MKKILLLCAIPALFFLSCKKDNDAKEDSKCQVKLSETVKSVEFRATEKVDKICAIEVECSSEKIDGDLAIAFAVDPSAVPAGATLLPEAAYSISETAVTLDEENKKGSVSVTVSPIEALETGVDYVLPVRISSEREDIVISDAVILIHVMKKARSLARIPVGGTVASCKDFFILRDKYLITRDAATGVVAKYEYDAAANSFGEADTLATDFNATNVRLFGPAPGNSIHYVIDPSNTVLGSGWADVWVYQATDATISALKTYDKHDGKISTGCGMFWELIRGPHSAGIPFVDKTTGGIRFYGVKEDGHTLNGSGNGTTGDALYNYGNAHYQKRFVYKDNIYGVGANPGTLYRHTYNASTKLFNATPVEVGSNWAQFLNICQFGDNLLCQKSDGSLVMYEFDPEMDHTWDANYVEPAE